MCNVASVVDLRRNVADSAVDHISGVGGSSTARNSMKPSLLRSVRGKGQEIVIFLQTAADLRQQKISNLEQTSHFRQIEILITDVSGKE